MSDKVREAFEKAASAKYGENVHIYLEGVTHGFEAGATSQQERIKDEHLLITLGVCCLYLVVLL